jgi:hypothetical protein
MNKTILAIVSIFFILISNNISAKHTHKHCSEVDIQISTIDKHADNYYSLANYQFDDKALLKNLRANTDMFNDASFEDVLNNVELAIKSGDDDLMMKIAPLSRYLNGWRLDHCS